MGFFAFLRLCPLKRTLTRTDTSEQLFPKPAKLSVTPKLAPFYYALPNKRFLNVKLTNSSKIFLTEKSEENNNGSGYSNLHKSKLSKISLKPVDVGLETA